VEDMTHTHINDPDKSIESMLMPERSTNNYVNESAVIYQESQESLVMMQTKEPAANTMINKIKNNMKNRLA